MTEQKKLEQSAYIACIMSVFMTVAALVYMFVLGMFLKPEEIKWWMMIPTIILFAISLYVLVKPPKMEW